MEYKILNDMMKLTRWALPVIGKFPRNYRYSLGLKIENQLYLLIDRINSSIAKTYIASELNAISNDLNSLRLYVRLAEEMKLFQGQQHYAFIQQIDELGRQVGGMIKAVEKTKDNKPKV